MPFQNILENQGERAEKTFIFLLDFSMCIKTVYILN